MTNTGQDNERYINGVGDSRADSIHNKARRRLDELRSSEKARIAALKIKIEKRAHEKYQIRRVGCQASCADPARFQRQRAPGRRRPWRCISRRVSQSRINVTIRACAVLRIRDRWRAPNPIGQLAARAFGGRCSRDGERGPDSFRLIRGPKVIRGGMFLRDYLYVDVDKVRGILSQIDEGVPESSTEVARKETGAELRTNLIGGFGSKSSGEESLERSFGDSLFKILENELEALGILEDISEQLLSLAEIEGLRGRLQPGALVRVTAPARLFHPVQLSHTMVGISTAGTGMLQFMAEIEAANRKNNGDNSSEPQWAKPNIPTEPAGPLKGDPEDALFYLPDMLPALEISRDFVLGLIRFIRGTFSDGVHLHIEPLGNDGPLISARLESGRRFLDATPEVLVSRYGFRPQEWTIVGTVGHFGALPGEVEEFDFESGFNRASIVRFIGTLLENVAGSFIGLPTGYGFSIVPLAVYRAIGPGQVSTLNTQQAR